MARSFLRIDYRESFKVLFIILTVVTVSGKMY